MSFSTAAVGFSASPVVIAHRGASGYLPEHTLQAASFAYALGADFIEQDVVMSKDDVLVVCHDIHIDTTTDVATRFPDRARADGRWYAIDFTWVELRSLAVRERVDEKTGVPVFPRRFPSRVADGAGFRLCTMEEEILLVQGLNRSTGRAVGIYPEIKAPAWHASEGKDPGRALLALLAKHGYTDAAHNVFVQCFDPVELKRLRPLSKLKFIQLIADNAWGESTADYNAMRTPAGLAEIARYAQGIGPNLAQVLHDASARGDARFTSLVADAHALGLAVHPYTFRADALPAGVESFDALMALFVSDAKVDGVFTDFTDLSVRFLRR